MRYAVVIEKAENNYSAYVPDLPGCVATGATVEEAEQLIREAIEFHLTGLREDGVPYSATVKSGRIYRGGRMTIVDLSVISRDRSRLRARQQLS